VKAELRIAARARKAAVGSTATTRCPIFAKPAASRPVPAPMSRTRPGTVGIRCSPRRWLSAKEMLSYRATSSSAGSAYPSVPLTGTDLT
jgi:hypothetical protein